MRISWLLICLFTLIWVTEASAQNTKPNILLIMADDMGFTDIGSFGAEIDTDNIDALAREGMRFMNFHTSVSCSPTRSMMLTGTDNHIAGLGNMNELITENQKGQPGYEGHLNDSVVTLAELLRGGGYNTYMAGKWHLGHHPDQIPFARGFDRSFTMLDGGASHWDDMTGLQISIQPVARYYLDDQKLEELPGDFYSSRSYADFLIDAIRGGRESGEPFFAYFAPTSAHDPVHVPEPWLSKYQGRYDDGYEMLRAERIARVKELGLINDAAPVPDFNFKTRSWESLSVEEKALEARTMEAYAGMINAMDYNIGRIFAFLKDIGEYDNTIIIFTSDNGPNPLTAEQYPGNAGTEWMASFDNSLENIGHKGSFVGIGLGWSQASAGPLDYFKLTAGEGGVRTPMIIAGPGVPAEVINTSFSYVMDVMPTLLDYAGVTHPATFEGRTVEPMRGRSLLMVTSGKEQSAYLDDDLIGAEMLGDKWMRKGDFKAVFVGSEGMGFGPGEWRLYNTSKDPGETQDLSDALPVLMAELTSAWESYADDVGVVPP